MWPIEAFSMPKWAMRVSKIKNRDKRLIAPHFGRTKKSRASPEWS
jgi:hypothetical protein